MKIWTKILIIFSLVNQTIAAPVVRIKDIANFEGVRENQLVGYGLVVGLNGTGDTLGSSTYTKESLTSMLERMGVNVRDAAVPSGKNVAAVMVTASLPPFSRQGTKIDISVSAMGDAKDLKGGTLLVTPLLGADGEVYAVGQGPVSVGGVKVEGKSGSSVTKGVPTAGRIANGAIIEKEIGFELTNLQSIKLSLRNPDLTTARRVAEAINHFSKETSAKATDPATVIVNVPVHYHGNLVGYMTDIEQLTIKPDTPAKIIIDDHDGVIVMGENVRVSTVAITHGNITIKITETPQVSQPNPFTNVTSATMVERSDIKIKEAKGKFAVIEGSVTLQDLVNGLNALGASPRDLITIIQSIKAAGALQADIEVI